MPLTAREAALKALGAYRRNNAFSGNALGAIINKSDISPRDAALAGRIMNGVLQNMTLCDYYISQYSSIELKKLEPLVLDILRISLYQLIFLSKVPNSAAVNEGVALAKKHSNPRAAGFVNAVLRKAAAAASNGSLPEIDAKTDIERLSIQYSHPEWLVREYKEILGAKGTEELLSASNADDTPITALINKLITGTDDVLTMLTKAGINAVRHKWLDDAIELRGTGNIEQLDAFKKGLFYIQDAAARLSVIASGVKPGDFVIDSCAAPGGKSFATAISMGNKGRILACDIHQKKLRLIKSGAERLRIGIIDTLAADASKPIQEFISAADVVIADVPCSGFGVIRKKPEIRYKPEGDIRGLPEVQKRILTNLSGYVKPGGVLLYSTCTIFRRENEEIVEDFLENNGGFYAENFTLPGVGVIKKGMTALWPHIHGTDGFFICKLRRRQ